MPDDRWEVVSRKPVVSHETPAASTSVADAASDSRFEVVSERPAEASPVIRDSLISRGRQILTQEESDIDYKTGAPFDVRSQLQGARNPNEAYKVMERRYGRGNFGQDRFDQWWGKEGDKRVSVLPKGFTGGLKNFLSGAVSAPFATAGGIAGAVGGEVAFPGGGGIPGTMLGAAAGKGLDDLVKWAMGTFSQKPSEVVGGMATEGALAGAFQGGGPALRQLGKPIQQGFRRFAGTAETVMRPDPITGAPTKRTMPTSSAVMARDLAAGPPSANRPDIRAVPPVGSYAPGATSVEYKRQLRDILAGPGGSAAERQNVLYLNSRMRGVLTNEGIAGPEVEQIMDEVRNTSSRLSTRAAGQAVSDRARGIHTQLLVDYTASRASAERMLNMQTQALERMGRAPDATGQEISDAIVNRRREFGRLMGQLYRAGDRMTGNTEVVSTALIRQQARQMMHAMPPTEVPPIIRQWAMLSARDWRRAVTFEQAHALRTAFREMGEITDVGAQGVRSGLMRGMAASVDQAIQGAAGTAGQAAAAALRQADTLYREGIRRFNNRQINSIVRELRSGIVPEPETITRLFMTPDNVNLARTVLGMLPEQTRRDVVRADLGAMMQQAATYNDRGRRIVDGQTLLRLLDERGRLLQATYPPDIINALRQHATELAAFDGRIDATALQNPTQIADALRQAVGSLRAAELFVQQNPLGAFVNGTPAQIDRALALVTRPGHETVTAQVAHTLGANSDAWRTVRRYALQRLFSSSVVQRRSLDRTVSGDAIDRALRGYTPQQQELLFPGGLADDLRILAKEARFLFPGASDDLGTSLAAASIKGGLWLNPLAVYKYMRTTIAGYIADHPRLLRYLTEEVRNDPMRARGVMSVLGQWIISRQIESGPGRGSPDLSQSPLVQPHDLVGRDPAKSRQEQQSDED